MLLRRCNGWTPSGITDSRGQDSAIVSPRRACMKVKTSKSHPLRVDSVVVDGVKGRIGLTFCPGKKQAVSMTGPWDRDLETDLKVIQSFGAAALVTLMEDHELREVMVLP